MLVPRQLQNRTEATFPPKSGIERDAVAEFGPTRPATTHAVSPAFLTAAIVCSLGLAAAFIPKDSELLARFLKDGDNKRALEFASDHGNTVIMKALDAPEPARTKDEQIAANIEQLRTQLTQGGGVETALISGTPALDAVLALVREHQANLDKPTREACYIALADLALSESDPNRSAAILEEAAKLGVESEALVSKRVQSLVWSDQTSQAVLVLQAWQETNVLPPELKSRQIQLLQAVNKSDLALEAMLPSLSENSSREDLSLAKTLAVRSAKLPLILPILEKALAKHPEMQASVEDLAKGRVAATQQWREDAVEIAKNCEWGGQPDKAFDLYLKLAAAGDRFALGRIISPTRKGDLGGLNRKKDIMQLLKVMMPIQDRPDLEVTAAQLMADSGFYEDAAKAYTKWLEKHPKDIAARTELAATYDEMSNMEMALQMHEEILKIDPANLNSRKEKADLLIGFKRFQAALQVYREFKSTDHDAYTLENYALLAESLADYPSRAEALTLRHKILKNPTSRDYYDLARAYLVLQKEDEAIGFLQEGLRRHPNSRLMWLSLARAYSQAERDDEAMVLLRKPKAKNDMEALMIFIDTAAAREEYALAFDFLGNGIEKQFAFGAETLLPLSSIYYHNGLTAQAKHLLSSVEEESTLWPLFAKTYYQQADYVKAEAFQRKYLKSLTVPDAPAWVTLGDICKVQGKTAEADEAYAKALQEMGQKMHNAAEETASNVQHPDHLKTAQAD